MISKHITLTENKETASNSGLIKYIATVEDLNHIIELLDGTTIIGTASDSPLSLNAKDSEIIKMI